MFHSSNAYPDWLIDSKNKISQNDDWAKFIQLLFTQVQKHLQNDEINVFEDLPINEREKYIKKALEGIKNEPETSQVRKEITGIVSEQLEKAAAQRQSTVEPESHQMQLTINCAQEAMGCLLQNKAQLQSQLPRLFNKSLHPKLRKSIWGTVLSNSQVRSKFAQSNNMPPFHGKGNLDFSISDKCNQLLRTNKTFSNLTESMGAHKAMKLVLIHYQMLKGKEYQLNASDYLLCIPFLMLHRDNLLDSHSPTGSVVAAIAEQYITFMNSIFTKGMTTKAHHSFVKRMVDFILENFPEAAPKLIFERPEATWSTEEISNKLNKTLHELTLCYLPNLLVGLLSQDVLLFIWDQIMLTWKAPDIAEKFLPMLFAIHLYLLRNHLHHVHDHNAALMVIREESPHLDANQFQIEIKSNQLEERIPLVWEDNEQEDDNETYWGELLQVTSSEQVMSFNRYLKSLTALEQEIEEEKNLKKSKEDEIIALKQQNENLKEKQNKKQEKCEQLEQKLAERMDTYNKELTEAQKEIDLWKTKFKEIAAEKEKLEKEKFESANSNGRASSNNLSHDDKEERHNTSNENINSNDNMNTYEEINKSLDDLNNQPAGSSTTIIAPDANEHQVLKGQDNTAEHHDTANEHADEHQVLELQDTNGQQSDHNLKSETPGEETTPDNLEEDASLQNMNQLTTLTMADEEKNDSTSNEETED